MDHGDKSDFLRSLGADHVLDYTKADFTESGGQYDLVLDTIAHRSVFACARALRPKGSYLFAGGALRVLFGALFSGPWIRVLTGKSVRLLVVPQDRDVLLAVTALCEERKLVPAIDRSYPLSEAREALRYVCEGRQQGKVVISFAD